MAREQRVQNSYAYAKGHDRQVANRDLPKER